MAILLFRVDERLIHGQVVVGWGNELHPDSIVVVDDDLAGSQWEQDLYRLGLADGVAAEFETAAQAIGHIDAWLDDDSRMLLLTRDISTMLEIARAGKLRDREVNIGGLHYAPGREAVLPYVYLDGDQREALSALEREGARVSARDLPGSRKVPVARLVRDEAE